MIRLLFPILFSLPALAAPECVVAFELLGNPVERSAESRKLDEMSGRELFTYVIGKPKPGGNPILNDAIAEAERGGVEIVIIESQALHENSPAAPFVERQNGNGAFFIGFDDKPVLALGKNIAEELLVHEVRHMKDFLKTMAQWQAAGMSRDEAIERYREAQGSPEFSRGLERNAIIVQLRHRYRETGFNLDDPNLIERVTYPHTSALLDKGLALRGQDGNASASQEMDTALWKALMIQKRRHDRVQQARATETNPGKRKALEKRAHELKGAWTLFHEIFPASELDANYKSIALGIFSSQLRGQIARLKTLKDNTFTIDHE